MISRSNLPSSTKTLAQSMFTSTRPRKPSTHCWHMDSSCLQVFAAIALLIGVITMSASAGTAEEIFDISQPPPFYTNVLPYCSLQRTIQGSFLTFPLRSKSHGANVSFIFGTIQMAARSSSLVSSQPLSLDGHCGSYLLNNGSIVTSLDMPDDATCGEYLIMCVPNGTTSNITADRYQLPVINRMCPTCSELPFALLRLEWNRAFYAECSYPMSLVCTAEAPSEQVAHYAYAAVNKVAVAAAIGWKNWTQQAWPGSEPITMSDSIKNYSLAFDTPIAVGPFVVDSDSFNQSAPLTVGGPDAPNATVCTIYNTITFTSSTTVEPGVAIPNVIPVCDGPVALAWATIDLLTTNCQTDSDCVGFTTKINEKGLAVVDCLMQRATYGFGLVDVGVSYRRMYFQKSRSLECKTTAGADGNLTIYAVLSTPATGRYDVYVNDVFVSYCTIAPTLSNCAAMNVCGNIQVKANSTIRVVPNQQFYDTTCGFASRVVMQLLSPPSPPLPPTFVARALPVVPYNITSVLNGYTLIRRFGFSGTPNPTGMMFYMNHVESVYLRVWQSGFKCPSCASPSIVAEFYNDLSSQMTCGGNRSFGWNMTGLSGQCDVGYLCRMLPVVKRDPLSPGYFKITGDFTSVIANSAASPKCQGVYFDIWAKGSAIEAPATSASASASYAPVSTFMEGIDSANFRVALYDANNLDTSVFFKSALVNASASQGGLTSSSFAKRLGVLGVKGTIYDLVDGTSLAAHRGSISTDLTQICVMDMFGIKGGQCRFTIPAGATHVDVQVENSNLQSASSRVTVRITESSTGVEEVVRLCGGTRFLAGGVAKDGSCGSYLQCVNESVRDVDGELSYKTVVVAYIPRISFKQNCVHAAVVFLTTHFEPSNLTADALQKANCVNQAGYYCRPRNGYVSDRQCISMSQICDGRSDCFDNSDESQCSAFMTVEDNKKPNDATSGLTASIFDDVVNSTADCLRMAIVFSANLFVYNSSNTSCTVYTSAAQTSRFLAAPTLVHSTGDVISARIASRLAYGRCTSSFTCNGNGAAFTVRAVDNTTFCACACDASYSGSMCGTNNAVGRAEAFAIRANINVSQVSYQYGYSFLLAAGRGLGPGGSMIGVSCTPLFFENVSEPTKTTTVCSVTSGTLSPTASSSSLASIFNNYLSLWLQSVTVSQVFALPSPGFSVAIATNCSVNATGKNLTLCGFFQPQPMRSIVISASTGVTAASIHLVVEYEIGTAVTASTSFANRRRLGSSPTIETLDFYCPTTSGYSQQSCFVSSCIFEMPEGALVHSIASGLVYRLTNTSVASKDICSAVSIAYNVNIESPTSTNTTTTIVNSWENTSRFWGSGIFVGSVAIILCTLGLLLAYSHASAMTARAEAHAMIEAGIASDDVDADDQLESDTRPLAMAPAENVKAISPLRVLLDYVGIGLDDQRKYLVRRLELGTFKLVFTGIIVIGFVVLVWVSTIRTFSSNYGVIFEQYNTDTCNSDVLAGSPIAAFAVTDSWAKCASREAAGDSAALAPYISAFCQYGVGGRMEVVVKTSFDDSNCGSDKVVMVVPVDTCVPITKVWSVVSDGSHMIVRCGTIDAIRARFNVLAGAGQKKDFENLTIMTTARDPAASYQNAWQAPNATTGFTLQVARFNDAAWLTLSSSNQRLAVNAQDASTGYFVKTSSSSLYDSSVAASYVTQFVNESFHYPVAPYYMPTASRLDSNDNGKVVTAELVAPLRPFAEVQPEFPIGLLFGNFNSTLAVVGDAAQPTAQWYYDAAKNPALDVGTMFTRADSSSGGSQTSRGATVTLHVQATPESVGFLFAIADAYEDSTQTSPLLTRLYDIVVNSKSSSWWFDQTFNVYLAVFLNGPRRQLQVVQAYAGMDAQGRSVDGGRQVSVITFNLEAVGSELLLNGAWHRIDLLLKNINTARREVQLVIDGVTGDNKNWVKCMSCNVRPIVTLAPGTSVPVRDPLDEVISGGVLTVGIINAGVQGLEIRDGVSDIYALRLETTTATQERTAMDVDRITALGICLIVVALAGAAYAISAAYLRYMTNLRHSHHLQYVSAMLMYKYCTVNTSDLYSVVPTCAGACRLLTGSDDVDAFVSILEELQRQSNCNGAKMMASIIAIIYSRRIRDDTDSSDDDEPQERGVPKAPSPEAWNEFVAEEDHRQARHLILNSSGFFTKLRRWFTDLLLGTSHYSTSHNGVTNFVTMDLNCASPVAVLEAEDEHQHELQANAAHHHKTIQSMRHPQAHLSGGGTRALRTALFEATTGTAGTTGNAGNTDNSIAGLGDLSDVVGSVTLSLPYVILSVLGILISPLQYVFMWMGKYVLPAEYLKYFFKFFAFVSAEVSDVFPTIEPLATSYLMIVAGLTFAILSIILLLADRISFYLYFVQYVLRRDVVDTYQYSIRRGIISKTSSAISSNPLDVVAADDDVEGSTQYIFSKQDYRRIVDAVCPWKDDVVTAKRVSHEAIVEQYKALPVYTQEESISYDAPTAIRVPDDVTESIQRGSSSVAKLTFTSPVREIATASTKEVEFRATHRDDGEFDFSCGDHHSIPCKEVISNRCCPAHTDQTLGAIYQSDVFPHSHPVQCCLSVDGQLCNRSHGQLRSCGKVTFVDGKKRVCQYAVCDRHFRATLWELIVSDVIGNVRRALDRGALFILTTIIFVLSNALYAPIVKRCMMIVWCHPTMQCALEGCSFDDRRYVVIFVFAVFTLAFFGVGYPLVLLHQMSSRKSLLRNAFFAIQYGDMYVRRSHRRGTIKPPAASPGSARSNQSASFESDATSDTSSQASGASVTGAGGVVSRLMNTRVLSLAEWGRFVSTDPSAGSYFYRTVAYEFMYFIPLMLYVRAAIVVTIVVSPSDPFVSHFIVAVAEFVLLCLLCWGGFVAPMVELVYRLGSVHQLLLFGLICLDVANRYRYGHSSHQAWMVVISLVYMAFCAGCVGYALMWTPFRRWQLRARRSALLKKLGLRKADFRPITITPCEIPAVAFNVAMSSSLPESLTGEDVEEMAIIPPQNADSPPQHADSLPQNADSGQWWAERRKTPEEQRQELRQRQVASTLAAREDEPPASPVPAAKDDPIAFAAEEELGTNMASPLAGDDSRTMGASISNPNGQSGASGASHLSRKKRTQHE